MGEPVHSAADAAQGAVRGPWGPTARPWARRRGSARASRRLIFLLAALAIAAAYFGYGQYRVRRLADAVRTQLAARNYAAAEPLLAHWLSLRPGSAEAHYNHALLALGLDRLDEAASAVDRAAQLGADRQGVACLRALIQARAGRLAEVEPALLKAYSEGAEPRADVARELARLYLSTYRLEQARAPIERWKSLVPDDPRPYLWLNEIESRTGAEPAVLMRNDREALARDPGLLDARRGLAEQLLKNGQFDEAETEFQAVLERRPTDPAALSGLGRAALARGDAEAASRRFEAALEADPRHIEALRELAQIELRRRQVARACEHLERLVELEPYDHGVRYQLAQALKLQGNEARAHQESEKADELRRSGEYIDRLRTTLLEHPDDMETRCEVARWMFENGHEAEGLDWTRQILRADPRHAKTHRLLAEYHGRHGNAGLANYHRLLAGPEATGAAGRGGGEAAEGKDKGGR